MSTDSSQWRHDDPTTDRTTSGTAAAPAELVSHLVHMERRWFVWGFLGEDVGNPWADRDDDDGWQTTGTLDQMLDAWMPAACGPARSCPRMALTDIASAEGRFADGEPPTLLAILFHVMQEYARHMGHLDIVRELIDGTTGEG